MIVVFQGVEGHDHRDALESVHDLFPERPRIVAGLSFVALRRRRLTASYVRETASRFPVVIEAGASQQSLTKDKALELEKEYYDFAESCPDILSVIQFDHPSLRDEDTRFLRDDPRLVPVLHDPSPSGIERVADQWSSVAMPIFDNRAVTAAVRNAGLMAMALAQPDLAAARSAGFSGVLTNSWVAPGRYGEVSIWDGTKYHRSSSERRAATIKRYASQIEATGLDLDLISKGDARECNRLAAHALVSWSQHLESQANTSAIEPPPVGVASLVAPATSATRPTKTVTFPGFATTSTVALTKDEDGHEVLRELPLVQSSTETVRQCSSCYLAVNCPAYSPGSSCRYNLPVEIRTDAQARSMLHTMVEMQAARVAFARFAEEVNGGYPDPVVSQEMDRLVSMTDRVLKQHERRERLTVSVEAESSGVGTGVLSRLFGGRNTTSDPQPAQIVVDESYLPDPTNTE